MKRIFSIIAACAFLYGSVSAQCTPDTSLTASGLYPVSDSLACVERTVAYSQDVQVVLPASFGGFITLTDFTVDTIMGLPSGITYSCNPSTCVFPGGTVSCMHLGGTTTAAAGTYPLTIIATANTSLGSFGPMDLDSLLGLIPGGTIPPVNYELKVINQGEPCVPQFGVTISGDLDICPGESTTLTADVANGSGNETYLWSPGNETTQSITVNSTGTYSVTVTDQANTVTASVTVDPGQAPAAGFNVTSSSLTAFFTNTSVDATSYEWDFGDGDTSTTASPNHVYDTAGTYTVALIATNGCGSDTTTKSLTVQLGPCTAGLPTGTPGVFPDPDAIPCIERGVAYDYTMQTENYDTFSLNVLGFPLEAVVNFTRIDSITNFPCGITAEWDKAQYGPGETGCIKVSGTSREVVGQYPVKIYMTFSLSAFGQTIEQGGEVTSLISQLESLTGQSLGLDMVYISRVINPNSSCPNRDTNADEVSSGTVCPPFSVEIKGNPTICSGQSTTLTATPKYETGTVTYAWSPGNQTTAAIIVSSPGTYSVVVTDQNGTATSSVTVGTGTSPTASFTTTKSGPVVTVTNSSSTGGGTTYSWNYGDNTPAVSGQNPPAHTYAANGSYNIILTVTNNCGTAKDTQTVTITGVFVTSIEYDLSFDVFPNPSNGTASIRLTAENSDTHYELRIFDLSGKNIYSERLLAAGGKVEKQLDLSGLAKGVYTLRIDSEKGFGVKKLILN